MSTFRSSPAGDIPPEELIGARTANSQLETAPGADVARCYCPHPPANKTRRNLVVCIDGTANQFGKNNSNVIELYSRLTKSEHQLTYYNSGIGTYVKGSKIRAAFDTRGVHHVADLMFAINFKEKVLKAYQWLSENYEPGDRIFLFGFSRGAYQVRVIAGMIEKIGLLHKGNNEQISFAYGLYLKSQDLPKLQHQQAEELKLEVEQFKKTLSRRGVRVHFIGAWDTVSSIGLIKKRCLPETSTGMAHVCTFRHALALDELRVKFLPEYANGGGAPGPPPQVKEVWFAGSHSDVGGGHASNLKLNQFGPSLRWMSYEAIRHGLELEAHHGYWEPLNRNPSMTLFYKFIECLPVRHLSYEDPDKTVRRWHLQKPRLMKAGQLIHATVFEEEGYRPKALTHDGTAWDKDAMKLLTEEDPYADASYILRKLEKNVPEGGLANQDINVINTLTTTEIGSRSITEYFDGANILIAALLKEISRAEGSNKSITSALLSALYAFKSAPYYAIKPEPAKLAELWSVLEQRYPATALENFRTIFGRPFFALIIGIDTYEDTNIRNMPGCVADADDIEAFLTKDLHILPDRIVVLRNEEATHARIVQEIEKLAKNDSVAFKDPILIYYAGCCQKIQDSVALFPYDGAADDGKGSNILPDTELNCLLKQLANKKGDNITVMLDTSYASGFGGEGYAYASSDSHILLAACSKYEAAAVKDGRGLFTKRLTTVLRELGPHIWTVTYQDVVSRLRPPGFGIYQTPNCRGRYDNRIIFETRTPEHDRKFHAVKNLGNNFRLEAGEIHGITKGARFDIYCDNDRRVLLGSLEAVEVAGFSTSLGFSHHTVEFTIPEDLAAYGLQIRAGGDSAAVTKFAFEVDADFQSAIFEHVQNEKDHAQPVRTMIQFVETSANADVVVRSAEAGQLAIGTMDGICLESGLDRLPYTLPRDVDAVSSTMKLSGEFFWDLRRVNSRIRSQRPMFDIEAYRLTESDPSAQGSSIPVHGSGNAIEIFLEGDKNALGFTITNLYGGHSFYVWLFAFNMLDFAIDIVYKPCFSGNQHGGDPCLSNKKSKLEVGYTLNEHNLPDGVEVGITYLKAFISSEYVDLSHIEKSSPFDRSSKVVTSAAATLDPNPSLQASTRPEVEMSKPLRLRGGGMLKEPKRIPIWDTLLVPIIIKRKAPQSVSNVAQNE